MVCPCLKVCRDDIVEAIDNGASNFKDVKKKTKIVTKCGKCKTRAKCLVREIFAEKDLLIESDRGVCLGCQGDFFEPEEDIRSCTATDIEKSCCEVKKQKNSEKKKSKHKKKKDSEKKKNKKDCPKKKDGHKNKKEDKKKKSSKKESKKDKSKKKKRIESE